MQKPPHFKDLQNRPMDRKEFLQHIMSMAALLFGGSLLYQYVQSNGIIDTKKPARGYGMSTYGGQKNTAQARYSRHAVSM